MKKTLILVGLLLLSIDTLAWYSTFNYSRDILNESTTSIGTMMNGSAGWMGHNVWVGYSGGDQVLFYNNVVNFSIAKDETSLVPYEDETTETGYAVTTLYGCGAEASNGSAVGVWHLGKNSTTIFNSCGLANGSISAGSPTWINGSGEATAGNGFSFDGNDCITTNLGDSTTYANISLFVCAYPLDGDGGNLIFLNIGGINHRIAIGSSETVLFESASSHYTTDTTVNGWSCYALSCQMGGNCDAYINKTKVATISATTGVSAYNMSIGCRGRASNDEYFEGKISEARFYSRTLSQTEINEIFDSIIGYNITNLNDSFQNNSANIPPITVTNASDASGTSYAFGSVSTSTYVKVSFSCSDSDGACNYTYYCVDTANSCTPNSTNGTTPVQINATGNYYLRYFSMDDNGLNESTRSRQIILLSSTTSGGGLVKPTIPTHKTDWNCSNMLTLLQEGDIAHGVMCPFYLSMGGTIVWFAAFLLVVTGVLAYMKTQTIAAPSILALISGGVYYVYLPPEVALLAGSAVAFGVVGIIYTIYKSGSSN